MEEYKIIEGFENYSVSKYGNVKNNITGRMMKISINEKGYCIVTLFKNGYTKHLRVHRLVAEAFIPNSGNKIQVDHIDNDKKNNNVNNLRWCSCSENGMNTKLRQSNTSGVKGVYYDKRIGLWRAQITHNRKHHHLGNFENIEDATKARQEAAKELFGEFINKVELEININNIKPNSIIKLNININNEQKELEELEREFEELIK